MPIYLDNSATTRVCEEAAQKVLDVMLNHYGNPSSLHSMGLDAIRMRQGREPSPQPQTIAHKGRLRKAAILMDDCI